jgi:hypothetical protein
MDGTHGIAHRLNRIVRIVAQIPSLWASQTNSAALGESEQTAYSQQVLDRKLRSLLKQARNALFPALAATRSSQSADLTFKQLRAATAGIRRSTGLFLCSTLLYVDAERAMLPLSEFLGNAGVVFTSVLLALAFRLQRKGLAPNPTRDCGIVLEPIVSDAYRRHLTDMRYLLLMSTFSPAEEPLRSGLIALTALVMLFGPSYPVVQWLRGFPFTAQVTWAGIGIRFVVVFILFGWFAWIWKASKLARKAIEDEIKALDAEAPIQ